MFPKKTKQKTSETPTQNENKTLFRGRHFSFLSVKTLFGYKEVISRNNENYFACKVLPLVIEDDDALFNLKDNQKKIIPFGILQFVFGI